MQLLESELEAACLYIERHFDIYSWWPTAQPGAALEQFNLMRGSVTALNVWCDRWLDEAQCKQLAKCVKTV